AETANFQPLYAVVFTESALPSGTSWSVTFGGTQSPSTTTTISFSSVASGLYSFSTLTPVTVGQTQYCASPSSGSMNVPSSTSQSISYSACAYYLTMSAGAGGTVSPSSEWVNSGSSVTITATPSSGYYFSSWSGTGTGSYSGSSSSQTITVNNPITETAAFIANPTVTFTESGLPSGTSWTVTFNGSPHSSTTATISIPGVSPGSYSWSTGNPTSC